MSSLAGGVLHRLGLALPLPWRVYGAFFLYAFAMGGIFPRLPEIQRSLGASEGTFGLALIGTACGTLVSLTFAGRWLDRVGHRRALLGLVALLPLLYALASHARGPFALFMLLVPAGLCIGAVEIVVNLEADRVEHLIGRRFMNRAHGFWSLGFFVAGMVGASMAQWGVTPQMHLAIAAVAVWIGLVVVLGRFDAAPHRPVSDDGRSSAADDATRPPLFARPTAGVMWLVAVCMSAMVLEGAGADWSAIYMRNVFAASPFDAGLAVATGALAQGLSRFVADRYVERYQPVLVARVLLGVLGTGTAIVFAAPAGWVALVGFALMGIGTSAIFPLAMSAAAQRTDRPAATNVAALAQISFVAFLLGPPLLGHVAQAFGIRWAFGVCLPLVLLSIAAAGSLRGTPAAPQ